MQFLVRDREHITIEKYRPVVALVLAAAVLAVACGSPTPASDTGPGAALEVPASSAGTRPPETSSPDASPRTARAAPVETSTTTATTTPEVSSLVGDATSTVGVSPQPVENAEVARLGREAWDHLVKLTEEFSPRASGTAQERAAAEYLAASFREMGYRAELQPFTVEVLSPDIPMLSIATSTARDIRAFPMTLSGNGRASAALVDAGRAFEEDVASLALKGKVALIERGVISFEEKVGRVVEAGAIAAVVYNNESGAFGGQLATQANIPVVAISKEEGESIKRLMGDGAVTANVSVVYEMRQTANVIAEKPGAAGDSRVIVLGGHLDTVPNVPGANDNGSGIATLLAIAKNVADSSYPFTVRFVPFGSEELGLLGSQHYVASLSNEEKTNVIAMLNFDALATGPVTGVLGDFGLARKVLDYASEHEIEVKRRLNLGLTGGSSDHASFKAVGIPVVFFLADDFSRIHTPEDTLEFAQPELMGTSAALAIGLLDLLAQE